MKKVFIIITIVLAVLAVALVFMYIVTPPVLENTTTLGLKVRSQTWAGTITVKGDVTYAPWARLTVEPGTRVLFDKNPDVENTDWTKYADAYIKDHHDPTGRTGYAKSHFHVYGTLKAIGTPDQPIVFTSAQTKPEYADWDQLSLRSGSELAYVQVSYAHNGVNFGGNNSSIRHSVVHDSLWSCVDIFSVNNTVENNEMYHCWHQAIGTKKVGANVIANNSIHDSQLGINCENGSRPTLTGNSLKAAPWNPDCGPESGNTVENETTDVAGGTYQGQLIYPAPAAP